MNDAESAVSGNSAESSEYANSREATRSDDVNAPVASESNVSAYGAVTVVAGSADYDNVRALMSASLNN